MSGAGPSSSNTAAAPIRQPRGPSPATSAFGSAQAQPLQSSAPSRSPPKPDGESLLRRNNTISSGHATSRHHFSASISASPAASSAFHGGSAGQGGSSTGAGRFRGSTPAGTTLGPPTGGGVGFHRFRSGSMSSTASAGTEGAVGGTLSRRQSGREVQRQEILAEAGQEEDAVELGSWGRGLGRQSSLPSRRGLNPVIRSGATQPDTSMPPPPPRPPRRISAVSPIGASASPTVPTHSASHSLSSLALLGRGDSHLSQSWDQPNSFVGTLSRTQSLRAQAQAKISGPEPGLGRSSSMRTAGEITYRSPHIDEHAPSPSGQTPTHMPSSYFGPPTPPPMSSTAALPPFQMPGGGFGQSQGLGADVRRHKSMNQAYARDGALSPEQRDGRGPRLMIDPLNGRALSPSQDRPPTSPIGPPSVWSMEHQPRDDGWSRPSQQLQEAFDAMSISKSGGGASGAPNLREPQPGNQRFGGPLVPGYGNQGAGASDEPAWVTNLVGTSPQLQPRSASAQTWHDRENGIRSQFPAQQNRFDTGPYLAQNIAYLQQQQQQLLSAGYGGMPPPTGMPFRPPGQPAQFSNARPMPFIPQPPYGAQVYPTPPPTAGMPSQPQLGPSNPHLGPPQQQPHHLHAPHQQQQHHLANQDAAVIELARSKGLNPATFDCRPPRARFFVIKSYTEDDVQKSLKHEIWSSTVLGNKRLDAAFKESADQMPIYLFFSVNGSRHFCGVAQMLTPVDESQSSDVWAQDKWKGIFKVKWIFVRDVPSAALRHIRLINTPEQKPITNSRDTQEIHYEGGCEVLQIFLDHQTKSKTSLLQDFAYYEQLSAQRRNQNPSPALTNPGNGHQGQMPLQPPHPNDLYMSNQHVPGANGIPPAPPIPARFR